MFKVERLEVVAVRVSPPPELAALRALRGEWVFVVAHGAYGLRGYGEATHSGDDAACARLIRQEWAPRLEDEALPVEPAALEAWLRRWTSPANDRVACTAYSAVEGALCDLAARTTEVPLWRWLSTGPAAPAPPTPRTPAPPEAPLYATLNRGIFDRSPRGFAAAARQAAAEGFRRLKCAPFDGVTRGGSQRDSEHQAAIDLAFARLDSMRADVPPDVELMVDCHGRLLEHEAPSVAQRLAHSGVRWLEEPVPFDPDPAALARVRRALRQNPAAPQVAAGELMFGVDGFRPLLDSEAVDIVMPDVKHCGGVMAACAIAQEAAARSVATAPHNPSGPISTLASAHVCAAVGGLLEYAWGEVPWRAALLRPNEAIRDGTLRLSDGPGLGADLEEAVVREHAFPI